MQKAGFAVNATDFSQDPCRLRPRQHDGSGSRCPDRPTPFRRLRDFAIGDRIACIPVRTDGTGTIMQFLRPGDELVALRLGRSTRDVLNLVHELDEKGASLRVLEPEVTTAGSMGRMVVTILGMVADMELKFIKDRQSAGIRAAKADGVYKGRTKNVDDEEIRRRIAKGASKASVACDLKLSRMTVYRALVTESQSSRA